MTQELTRYIEQLPVDPSITQMENYLGGIYQERDSIVSLVTQDNLESALRQLRQVSAIEKYLQTKDHKAMAMRAARVLETAIGEALGPAKVGRPRTEEISLASDISANDRLNFRRMAEYRALWWQALEQRALSRAEALRIIDAARPASTTTMARAAPQPTTPASTISENSAPKTSKPPAPGLTLQTTVVPTTSFAKPGAEPEIILRGEPTPEPGSETESEPETYSEPTDEQNQALEREYFDSIERVMAADDKLAAAHEEIKRQAAQIAALKAEITSHMNAREAAIKLLKEEQSRTARMSKKLDTQKTELEALRERVGIIEESESVVPARH